MYVAQTPHIDPLMFHLALQQNAETDAVDGAEKTAFAWYALPAKSLCRELIDHAEMQYASASIYHMSLLHLWTRLVGT